jgi:dTDP-4-amino-4,6-dideoxygalactose transaminase
MHESWGIFMKFNTSVAHLAVFSSIDLEATTKTLKSNGVGLGRHYPISDNKQKAWKDYFNTQRVPNSEHLCAGVVSLPCHPFLTESEISQLCEVLSIDLNSQSVTDI